MENLPEKLSDERSDKERMEGEEDLVREQHEAIEEFRRLLSETPKTVEYFVYLVGLNKPIKILANGYHRGEKKTFFSLWNNKIVDIPSDQVERIESEIDDLLERADRLCRRSE